jgi:hypothetical protein
MAGLNPEKDDLPHPEGATHVPKLRLRHIGGSQPTRHADTVSPAPQPGTPLAILVSSAKK